MTLPKHLWVVERDPFEGDAILAAYGPQRGYFLQSAKGDVTRPSRKDAQAIVRKFGPAPMRDCPVPSRGANSAALKARAAITQPYEKRQSSADARMHGF